MKGFVIAALLNVLLVSAIPAPAPQANGGPPFDPSGAKNVGNGAGKQFIGGQCLSSADCGSGCCALPSGICSGPGAQFQAGKQGCGFGDGGAAGGSSNSTAAAGGAANSTAAAGGADSTDTAAGAASTDTAAGADSTDTAAGADSTDTAAGAASTDTAAGADNGAAGAAGANASSTDTAAAGAATGAAGASAAPANGGPPFDPSGVKNVGNGAGKQFIGGQCLDQSDCGSGCCAGPSGICSGPGAQTQNGKTGCGFVSKNAANKRVIARLLAAHDA